MKKIKYVVGEWDAQTEHTAVVWVGKHGANLEALKSEQTDAGNPLIAAANQLIDAVKQLIAEMELEDVKIAKAKGTALEKSVLQNIGALRMSAKFILIKYNENINKFSGADKIRYMLKFRHNILVEICEWGHQQGFVIGGVRCGCWERRTKGVRFQCFKFP